MKPKRKRNRDRSHDARCDCRAYPFPHRQFGGRCTLRRWVHDFFPPHRAECFTCVHRDEHECQCVSGVEAPHHCPELRTHIRYHEIVLYGAAREAAKRSTKGHSERMRA